MLSEYLEGIHRVFSFTDIEHYEKIVFAITCTIDIQKGINRTYLESLK